MAPGSTQGPLPMKVRTRGAALAVRAGPPQPQPKSDGLPTGRPTCLTRGPLALPRCKRGTSPSHHLTTGSPRATMIWALPTPGVARRFLRPEARPLPQPRVAAGRLQHTGSNWGPASHPPQGLWAPPNARGRGSASGSVPGLWGTCGARAVSLDSHSSRSSCSSGDCTPATVQTLASFGAPLVPELPFHAVVPYPAGGPGPYCFLCDRWVTDLVHHHRTHDCIFGSRRHVQLLTNRPPGDAWYERIVTMVAIIRATPLPPPHPHHPAQRVVPNGPHGRAWGASIR